MVPAPGHAGRGGERPAQRALRRPDSRAHLGQGHLGQVLVGVIHGRGHERVAAGWQAQRGLAVEPFDDEVGEGFEEGVGHRVLHCPADRPPLGVQDHLPDHRCGGEDADPVARRQAHRRVEEDPDGLDVGHRAGVNHPGWDPDGLLGREEIARRRRLDVDDAFERALQLVNLVRMPTADHFAADPQGVRAGSHHRYVDTLVPQTGRDGRGRGRTRGDRHGRIVVPRSSLR
ncbi:hypothetical protein FRAHR75_640040 [Frankia sp. Hr75.2]|nr:hypothetical protein FRAHR75_640040 [Frankia sp. Hr75.2]